MAGRFDDNGRQPNVGAPRPFDCLQYGHFSNERSLSPAEIRTLVTWVNGGAQEGDPKDMPPPVREFVEGWGIPQPDMVVQLPQPFPVPAAGVIDYQYVIVPNGFKEDKWVQMLEVRPTDRSVVRHIIAYLREPGSNYSRMPWNPDSY